MARKLVLLTLPAALWVASCRVAELPTPTSTADRSIASPSPSQTASPALQPSAVELVPGRDPGDWLVLAVLDNTSEQDLIDVVIQVTLSDDSGATLATQVLRPTPSGIPPGSSTPILARFQDLPSANEATVEIISQQTGSIQRADLELEMLDQFVTQDGELAILISISNLELSPVRVSNITFLARDAESRLRALAEMRFGPSTLAAGETTYLLAVAAENPGHVRWSGFHDGVLDERGQSASIILIEGPELRFTPQGAAFVIGSVRNPGSTPLEGSVMVVLRANDRIVSLSQLELPIPLDPGSSIAFTAFDFPGFSIRAPQVERAEIQADVRLEATASELGSTMLMVEVDTFHSVGSVLFIGGTARNGQARAVRDPTVLAEIRTVDGELLSAGWATLESQLNPDEMLEFVLELPLAAEIDISQTEIDLRAIGTTAQP